MKTAQEYLNRNYQDKREEKITLSGWIDEDDKWEAKPKSEWPTKLTGKLDLSEFPNLKELNCSYNEITSLDISKCSNLEELKCWGNEIEEIKFPKSLPKLKIFHAWTNRLTKIDWNIFEPKTLTKLSISNNDLEKQDVSIFKDFTKLEELCLGTDIIDRLEKRKYNRFHGSLKSLLENCAKLEKLQIEETWINNDLDFDCLPKSLKIISWHKQNDKIARIIPLERLYVIRSNIKQFLVKWGEKTGEKWYEKVLDCWKKQKQSGSDKDNIKLNKLESLEEIDKNYWWASKRTIYATQFLGRGAAVAGVVLSFQDYGALGSGILGIYPFAELLISNMEKSREDKKSEWKEFLTDSNKFLDNYNELLGILDQFDKSSELDGEVNKAIKSLNEKTEEVLKICVGTSSTTKDGEIDISELTTKRGELIKDLKKDKKMQGMIGAIKVLEKAVIKYRQFSYYQESIQEAQIEVNNNIITIKTL